MTAEAMYPFTQRGGGRFGRSWWFALRVSPPLLNFSASSDAIAIKGGWSFRLIWGKDSFVLPKAQIQRLSYHRAPLSTGLRIEHSVEGAPSFIVLWAWDMQQAAAALTQLGYRIEG